MLTYKNKKIIRYKQEYCKLLCIHQIKQKNNDVQSNIPYICTLKIVVLKKLAFKLLYPEIKMLRKLGYILIFLFLMPVIKAQMADTLSSSGNRILEYKIDGKDTVYLSTIQEIYIFPERKFKSKRDYRRYQRLIYNVKKVYPYAILAREKLKQVNAHMLTLKTDKQKKEYIKQVEKEIRDEFEGDLKNLTLTQGRILIKLIDRETGETSYDLVKELRGAFPALFWQTLARVFGSNLKSQFDAAGEDQLINEIIVLIENGQL